MDSAFWTESNRPAGSDFDLGAVHLGVHNRMGLWWDAQSFFAATPCHAATLALNY